VRLLRRDVDRIVGLNAPAAAPRVGDDADRVQRLVRERPLESAEAAQDEESRARADADQLRARRDTLLASARSLARTRDDPGAVGAVADMTVGVGTFGNAEQRREAGQRPVSVENLDVLDHLLAERQIPCVASMPESLITTEKSRFPSPAGRRSAASSPRRTEPIDAGQDARLIDEVVEAIVAQIDRIAGCDASARTWPAVAARRSMPSCAQHDPLRDTGGRSGASALSLSGPSPLNVMMTTPADDAVARARDARGQRRAPSSPIRPRRRTREGRRA
jgi:hypothetical protein